MRNFFYVILFILFPVKIATAQCNDYYQFKEGSQWEMETFNAKGKKIGKSVHRIEGFMPTASGYKASVGIAYYNKRGKLYETGDFDLECRDGNMLFNMEEFIPEESQKAFVHSDFTMEGEPLEWPMEMSVGQTLKDAHIELNGPESAPMHFKLDMFERKIESKEKVETPAGVFECFKVTYKMKIKAIVPQESSGIHWIAKGIGTVKTQNFNKHGKLVNYTVITKHDF